jgi:hypothetical protein
MPIDANRDLLIRIPGNCGSKTFTDNSCVIGDFCAPKDLIYAIIPSKSDPEQPPPPHPIVAALYTRSLTEPLHNKVDNSQRILVNNIRDLQKERQGRTGLEKRMEEVMTRVQGMIEESVKKEREAAEKKLGEERARSDKRIDESREEIAALKQQLHQVQSDLKASNDRGDEMHYKLNELDAVSKVTVEWISTGVSSELVLKSQSEPLNWISGYEVARSYKIAKSAQHRTRATCYRHQSHQRARRSVACLARTTRIQRRLRCQTRHRIRTSKPVWSPASRAHTAISRLA